MIQASGTGFRTRLALHVQSLALSRGGPILIVPGKPSSVSPFHRNGEPLYLFVLAQFRAENRYALFLELL
ncbi:MAG: hypothetical protein EOS38_15030 [Mesorhizobium sp.]|nr:hypothetical protein EOA38_31010 [Mesorhizobium sp. M1E.F.Ca.ET.041.01.1.1]RWD88411.1 MAG: hypothetical protein EOS38_15030 [Mesorhizobium sp.]